MTLQGQLLIATSSRSRSRRAPRAFTTIEVLITVLILGIVAAISFDVIADTEAASRADRAARESLVALRHARSLAMTTGNISGVEFDTTLKKIRVFTFINGTQTWVTNALSGGNPSNYQIDLANDREVLNVTLTPSIPTDATNPYDITYNTLGATKNTGTVKFTYGRGTRVLTILSLADPTLN